MEQFLEVVVKYAEMLYPYLIAIIPALTAIGTCTIICTKIIGAFKSLRKEVADKTEMSEIRAEMKADRAEYRAIKRRLDKLITIEGKVQQDDQEI